MRLHNGQSGLIGGMPVTISVPENVEGDCIDMVASTETLDRYDEVIRASGWDLTNYEKNPVIQNCHQYGDVIFTLGKALMTKVSGTALIQRWQFASDVNPMARLTFGLYKGGYLNASSVGFIPLKWVNGQKSGEPARTYTRQELLEVSAVSIPANPAALALALKNGAIEKNDLREAARLLNRFCNQAEPPDNARAAVQRFHVARLQMHAQTLARLARAT